jgi:plasmid maintenance system antidote protein VapI
MVNMNIKPIQDAPGYSVSDCGKVFSKRGEVLSHINAKGYRQIKIGNYGAKRLHRLVASAFIENPFQLKEVNHIDGDKLNNHVSNLEWCSRKQNMAHAFATGLCKVVFGENAPASKLSDSDVAEIKRLYVPRSKDFSCTALGKRYGVDQSRIHQIVKTERVTAKHALVTPDIARQIFLQVQNQKKLHRDVAAAIGVSRTTVTNIASRKTWASATAEFV